MKRDFDTILTDLEGVALKDGPPKIRRFADGRPVYDEATSEVIVLEAAKEATMKGVAFTAMRANLPGDEGMTGEAKLKLYALASKIVKGGVVDLTSEDVTLLSERIAKTYDFVTYGRVREILDTDPAPGAGIHTSAPGAVSQ